MIRTTVVWALALSLLAATQDESLTWKRSKGSSSNITVKSELSLDVTIKDSENPDGKKEQTSQKGEAEYAQEVLVAENGLAKRIQIQVKRSIRQVGVKEEKTALDGLTFVVKRSSPTSSVTVSDGRQAPKDAYALGGWEDAANLLPSGKVAVGATWTVAGSKLAGIVSLVRSKGLTGDVTAKLESVTDGKATISFSGKLGTKTSDGFTCSINIEKGSLVLNTAKSAPVSVSISGDFEMHRDITETRHIRRDLPDGTPNFEDVTEVVGSVHIKASTMKVTVTFD